MSCLYSVRIPLDYRQSLSLSQNFQQSEDVETIVAKAVTAATKVVREEFEKLFRDMSERIQQLERRLEAVESAVETVVQDQRPNVCADIAELAGKMEATVSYLVTYTILHLPLYYFAHVPSLRLPKTSNKETD